MLRDRTNILLVGQKPEQANAVAALANAAIAAMALIVAVASIIFAARSLRTQRVHNRLSVKPIPFVSLADYENFIRVKVRNDGTGPMIVKGIDVLRANIKEHEELVSYMPPLPPGVQWSNFSSGFVRSIQAGRELILLELQLDLNKQHQTFYRNDTRKALSELKVVVRYTDVYDTQFDPISRDLTWFGRRLASSRAV